MQKLWKAIISVGLCVTCLGFTAAARADGWGDYAPAKQAAVSNLLAALSSYRGDLYVYRDYALSDNHFTQKAKIFGTDGSLVHDMDENCQQGQYAGDSCIRCELEASGGDWGGWMFLNGYLPEGETTPRLNDGRQPAGVDLTGATQLRFFAKGERGGEVIEFFTMGFGYNGDSGYPEVEYPDTAEKQTFGQINLSDTWQEYTLSLEGLDLRRIANGFGFVVGGTWASMADNVFYLDEIRFTGDIASLQQAPVLLRSYRTDNVYIRNAAFSYDNALVAMALLSEGKQAEAAALLDAFAYAVANDRDAPGRVRNAYAAGDISPFPGWEGGARLPGWYDRSAGETGTYFEDRYQVGSNTGNTSYVALAMLHGYQATGDPRYLQTASQLMDWVLSNCASGEGFTAGFDGWAEGNPPVVYPLTYKSIEHNIDAYAAFLELGKLTGESRYTQAAQSALTFIASMYDADAGVFYTGTLDDGVTPNKDNIVLDAQVWAAMALGDAFAPYQKALERVAAMRQADGGFPFCESNRNGGWWAEGTAYTALMYRLLGQEGEARSALGALTALQNTDGSFPAATVEALSTGFNLFTGEPWVYSNDAHIAPTAWFIMAVNGYNPYAFQP